MAIGVWDKDRIELHALLPNCDENEGERGHICNLGVDTSTDRVVVFIYF